MYFREISQSAPSFELGLSSVLNKGEMKRAEIKKEQGRRERVWLTQQEVFDRDPHGR